MPPASRSLATMPYHDLKRSLGTLGSAERAPPQPSSEAEISKSEFFRRPLPPSAIAELLHTLTAGRPPGQRRELNLTPMGGASNRVPNFPDPDLPDPAAPPTTAPTTPASSRPSSATTRSACCTSPSPSSAPDRPRQHAEQQGF